MSDELVKLIPHLLCSDASRGALEVLLEQCNQRAVQSTSSTKRWQVRERSDTEWFETKSQVEDRLTIAE